MAVHLLDADLLFRYFGDGIRQLVHGNVLRLIFYSLLGAYVEKRRFEAEFGISGFPKYQSWCHVKQV